MITQQAILSKVKEIPALSASVQRVYRLTQDPNANATHFEEAIRPDPALTANLLRLANSAFFGSRKEISSVRHAVAFLGQKRVFDLAVSAGFGRVLPEHLPGYQLASDDYWRHCIAVAVMGENIAKELGFAAPDLVFTAGLLHDIGKLVIGSFLDAASAELGAQLEAPDLSFVDAERAALGNDHCEIGATVAQHWDLPEAIALCCQWHHQPSAAPDSPHRLLVDLVHAANGLAHMMGWGADKGELRRNVDPSVVERLGIKARRLEAVVGLSMQQIEEMSRFLNSEKGAQ